MDYRMIQTSYVVLLPVRIKVNNLSGKIVSKSNPGFNKRQKKCGARLFPGQITN